MKKSTRFLSLLLSIIMILSILPVSLLAADSTGLDNFKKVNSYKSSTYTDVKSDDWFYDNVKSAYEYGLMIGKDNNLFDTEGNVTIAETMTIAARLHSIYYTGKADFAQSDPWYQVYADYCKANGIADPALYVMDAPATRAQFALILANAMPDEAWESINKVADNAIPDVKMTDGFSTAVYKLYRAGVLVGNDNNGTFAPDSNIRRCEVAAIVTRMVDVSLRQSVTLGDAADLELVASGFCGGDTSAEYDSTSDAYKNLTWTLYDDGKLVIAGKGIMKDYTFYTNKPGITTAPWCDLYFLQLDSLVINEGVTSIGTYAFAYCPFKGNLIIPNSVTSIGEYAFAECPFITGDLVIPDSVTEIGMSAFQWTRFTGNLIIGNGISRIRMYTFMGCDFTGELVIPDNVSVIGKSAFRFCDGFTGDLNIPSSVTEIVSYAFDECDGFNGVYFQGDAPDMGAGVWFSDPYFPENIVIYHIEGTNGWKDSKCYDPSQGTWCGYKLKTWDGVQ